jgi:hypothetical protein
LFIFINMSVLQEINRIKLLMSLNEGKSKDNDILEYNLFNGFKLSEFKKLPPPEDDSEETKKELEYLDSIDIDKRFVQEKDDILGNFSKFLDDEGVSYDDKLLNKIKSDSVEVIQSLKKHFKRPRPFKINDEFKDPSMKSTRGYSYPSGHSTQSNLLCLVLSKFYPKYEKDFKKIVKDIVYSRQMAKAHYPSDIKMGKKLAKSMFEYLNDNDLIH